MLIQARQLINCVSCVVPARSICFDAQLVNFSIISKITNFIYRFMQCGQNTVVPLMRGIQHCIFNIKNNWQEKTCERLTISEGIIYAQKNRRDNIHEYLTKIKKSEKNLQYSKQHDMIETSMDNNFNNANNFKNANNANTNKTSGRKHYFFKMISGITKVSFLHCPQYFLIKHLISSNNQTYKKRSFGLENFNLKTDILIPCPNCGGKMYSVSHDTIIPILKQRVWHICKECNFEQESDIFKDPICCE